METTAAVTQLSEIVTTEMLSGVLSNLRQSLYDNLVTTGVVVDSMITVYKDNAKPGSPLYVPVSIVDFVKIMSAWIGCITAYYVLSAILRWAKLIA